MNEYNMSHECHKQVEVAVSEATVAVDPLAYRSIRGSMELQLRPSTDWPTVGGNELAKSLPTISSIGSGSD